MEENTDEIVTEYNKGFFGKIRAFFGSIPGLIFLVGIALIFCGILMQVGYFDTSGTPTPSETVSDDTSTSDEDASDEEYDDSSVDEDVSSTIVDGVEITIVSGTTYTYGEFSVVASTLTSSCDDSNNCDLATNTVTLTFTNSSGVEYPFTLTPTSNSVSAGIGTIKANSWGDNSVTIQIN